MAGWTWDETQQRVLDHGGSPLLVLGAAGTGKTTLLVELLARRLRGGQTPGLAICLSRQAASAVRDRVIRSWGNTSLAPRAMTLHAFCLALVSMYADDVGAPRLLTAPEQEFRIRELLAGRGPAPWPEGLRAAFATRSFARQARGALTRARQLGLDPADLERAGRDAADAGWERLGRFAEEYLDVLDAEGVIDYSELVHRARILLGRPEVADAVRGQYGAVYVDEYAELDPAQLGLVRALLPTSGDLVAFADPDTAVFAFRGAHPRAVSEFGELFGGSRVILGVRHRSPMLIADAVASVGARLPAPSLGAAEVASYRSAEPGPTVGRGRVDSWTFPDESAQARRIASELRAEHLSGRRPWSDMAVLVRSGRRQLPALARALTDAGVPVEVAGDEIGLAEQLAVRPLLLALELAARDGPCDADEANRLLTSGWGGLDAVAMRTLGRALRAAAEAAGEQVVGRAAADLVARALSAEPSTGGAEGASKGAESPTPASDEEAPGHAASGPTADALATLAGRRSVLAQARAEVAAGRRPDEVLWTLWSSVPWPEELRAAAVSGSDSAPRANRDLDAVVALFELARNTSAPSGSGGIRAFLAEVDAQMIPADFERESAVHGRGVRLLTAHRAKGRAWPVVVVAGVQEGVWPDVRHAETLFEPYRLTNDGLGDGLTTRELVATERRLFALAVSRASERLLVTAVAGTEGEVDQPSRFTAEIGVAVRPQATSPVLLHTLRALVAALRVTADDPAASPELRRAATIRLAMLASETDDDGRHLVPDADPARWWGLREPTSTAAPRDPGRVVLTPSRLSSLLSCPRQYFLTRDAHADPPRSSTALLGSVIHALAEHALTEGLTIDNALDYLDQVWADIPFPAPWFSHSERAAAEAAVQRFMGWQAAHDYAEVVGVEVPFRVQVEVDNEPLTIAGTVDRLEKDAEGRLRVVDFKSGRSLPTTAEAAASEQLGLYQLAVEAGAFDALTESTGSAGGQLVYLRHGEDDAPKVFAQDPLRSKPHLTDDPAELAHPTWVHQRLAAAKETLAEGRFDATPGSACRWCSFRSSCPATSGQVIR